MTQDNAVVENEKKNKEKEVRRKRKGQKKAILAT